MTSDLGWAPLDVQTEAARLRGYLVPLTVSLALFVDARPLGSQGRMPIRHLIDVWPTSPEEVRELNQVLAAWAPRQLYGPTEAAVMDAAAGLGQAARGPWELPSQLLASELSADELGTMRLLTRADWTAACLVAGEAVMGAGFFEPHEVSFPKGSLDRWGIGLRSLAAN